MGFLPIKIRKLNIFFLSKSGGGELPLPPGNGPAGASCESIPLRTHRADPASIAESAVIMKSIGEVHLK